MTRYEHLPICQDDLALAVHMEQVAGVFVPSTLWHRIAKKIAALYSGSSTCILILGCAYAALSR
jgi:hypothetical protein